MRVLSLFDGMACGYIAMKLADVEVDKYIAYEIDKAAIQTSSHNFPLIEHRGDVFGADFKEFEGGDFLIGGSPCTYWSSAQTNNRETQASGLGWELFSQYVRALREAKPKYFIYENNKSMHKDIKASITHTFGFEPICINSALVSAQNRQRLYWVGIRQSDGSYRKCNVEQPKDRGVLIKDILEKDIPINISDGKSRTLLATYAKQSKGNFLGITGFGSTGVAEQNSSGLYNVENGMITFEGKQYPTNLSDGNYNIRRLTVKECMKLQTVPEWYQFPVCNSEAYKMLGNGWTCEVIAHLIKSIMEEK